MFKRKRFEAALKKCGYSSSGKVDQRRPKDSIDDAEQNREEVLKKVAAGKIVIEKADEKQNFKRNRVVRKVGSSETFSFCFRNQIRMRSVISTNSIHCRLIWANLNRQQTRWPIEVQLSM